MLISALELAEIFKMLRLMEFSKNDLRSEPFTSGICYCTVFEEDSSIAMYLLLISMLASRVLRKNTFLGNV